MAEYIDKEAALSLVQPDDPEDEKAAVTIATAKKLVRSIVRRTPAADVVPVVHGRWIGAPLCGNDNCKCSECGSWHNIHANLRGEIMQKYCPNCGARMDGDDDG